MKKLDSSFSPAATIAGIGAVIAPLSSLAQSAPQSPNWDWHGPWPMMMHGPGWGLWWLFPLLMMALMLVACVMMMRHMGGHGPFHRDNTNSAMQVLDERFARGEIQKEEYQEKRDILLRRR